MTEWDGDVADHGTPESRWAPWLAARADAELDLAGCARLVVVAPHPDDEILGVGGLAARLAAAGTPVEIVAVTDGDASHPDSPTLDAAELARLRVAESERACAVLGLPAPRRLGIGDGRVGEVEDALAETLTQLVGPSGSSEPPGTSGRSGPSTWVCCTWGGDGHPDHEATGRAAARACAETGARLVGYPVWTWHWAAPGDARVPWERRRVVRLNAAALERKRAAVAEFVTQVAPLSEAPADREILTSWMLERLLRETETVFW